MLYSKTRGFCPRLRALLANRSNCLDCAPTVVPRLFVVLALMALVSAMNPTSTSNAQTVTYAYDPAGRLVGVVDPNGSAAIITYDWNGNRLSVTTTNSNSVSIFSFSPANGPVGMAVTIYGDGFSTVPSQNTVKFNGTVATVTASTWTTITTTVPQGATTGTVAVTDGNKTGTSSLSFLVTPN